MDDEEAASVGSTVRGGSSPSMSASSTYDEQDDGMSDSSESLRSVVGDTAKALRLLPLHVDSSCERIAVHNLLC